MSMRRSEDIVSTRSKSSQDTKNVKSEDIRSSLLSKQRSMRNLQQEHSSPSTTRHSIISQTTSKNQELPNVEHDLRQTKLFLQKQGLHNLSIWSHLTSVLNKIVAEQPDNVIDYFEEYSRQVKQEKLLGHDSLRDVYVLSPHLESAKNQLLLVNSYVVKEDDEGPGGEEEEEVEPSKKIDLEEVAFYFRQAGIVIPDIQLFTINIAMKKLAEEKHLIKPRFWGKILGTKQDYFILECELPEEEVEKRAEEDELAEAAEEERIASKRIIDETIQKEDVAEVEDGGSKKSVDEINNVEVQEPTGEGLEDDTEHTKDVGSIKQTDESEPHEVTFDLSSARETPDEEDPLLPPLPPPKKLLKYKIPPILKPILKDTKKIPSEKIGEGVNRKIYYVSNNPELGWTELPKVTPEQITVARQVKVYLTGHLDFKIITYPAFPGSERNYLRTQIARISAATQVSPVGFYKFGEGGDEEEEEEIAEEEEEAGEKTKYSENPKFQPIPVNELIDPSLASWVHHSQHILPQGRTQWWSAKKPAGEEDEEEMGEEEEEEEEEQGGEAKESGPPLLTPLSEDTPIEGMPAWHVRKSHHYNSDLAVAIIKSNLWPGACAFATGKKFENIYIGWGHKHSYYGFSPVPLPHPEYEYDLGPEIMEIQDPTVEVEETWRQMHKKKPPAAEEEEEGEEGEEEEEEEEEDD